MPASDWPVEVTPFGCWAWTKSKNNRGYGTAWVKGKPEAAYLVVWRKERGEPPAGLVPDHTCRNRACVRPSHLEWVTKAVNEMRKGYRYRARTMTTLPCGCEFARAGMMTPQGGKVCRRH